MNRTVMFIVVGIIVALGMAGFVVLTALGIDASTFAAFATATFATTVGAGVTLYQVGQVKDAQKAIARSVNGNTEQLLQLVGNQLPDETREAIAASQANLRKVADGEAPIG